MIMHTNCSISDINLETIMRLFMIVDNFTLLCLCRLTCIEESRKYTCVGQIRV